MKTIIIIAAIFLVSTLDISAQSSFNSNRLFAQNYWHHQAINTNAPAFFNSIAKPAGVRMVRIGGREFNGSANPNHQPLNMAALAIMVSAIKAVNMVPIVQTPIGTSSFSNANMASDGVAIVNALNTGGAGNGTFCYNFIVGNEPDVDADQPDPQNPGQFIFNFFGFKTVDIFNNTMSVIPGMRSAQAALGSGVSLVFTGPSLTHFRNNPFDQAGYENMVQNLSTNSSTTNLMASTSRVNIFSFHYYASGDQANPAPFTLIPSRSGLIATIRQPAPAVNPSVGPPAGPVVPLKTNITTLKSFLSQNTTPVRIAITEANICFQNDISGTNDGLAGNGANSFLAGQFWSEIMSIGMEDGLEFINFWSMEEGQPSDNFVTNIGFWNPQINTTSPYQQAPWNSATDNEKYTWSHYYAIANHLRGMYAAGANLTPGLKVFGTSWCGGHAVVIMNQTVNQPPQNLVINIGNGSTLGSATYNGWTKGSVDLFDIPSRDLVFTTSGFNYGGNLWDMYTDQIRSEETIVIEYDVCNNPIFICRIRRGDIRFDNTQGPYGAACQCNNPPVYVDPGSGGGGQSGKAVSLEHSQEETLSESQNK